MRIPGDPCGVDVNAPARVGAGGSVLSSFINKQLPFHCQGGWTPLHRASEIDSKGVVATLLGDNRVNINAALRVCMHFALYFNELCLLNCKVPTMQDGTTTALKIALREGSKGAAALLQMFTACL